MRAQDAWGESADYDAASRPVGLFDLTGHGTVEDAVKHHQSALLSEGLALTKAALRLRMADESSATASAAPAPEKKRWTLSLRPAAEVADSGARIEVSDTAQVARWEGSAATAGSSTLKEGTATLLRGTKAKPVALRLCVCVVCFVCFSLSHPSPPASLSTALEVGDDRLSLIVTVALRNAAHPRRLDVVSRDGARALELAEGSPDAWVTALLQARLELLHRVVAQSAPSSAHTTPRAPLSPAADDKGLVLYQYAFLEYQRVQLQTALAMDLHST